MVKTTIRSSNKKKGKGRTIPAVTTQSPTVSLTQKVDPSKEKINLLQPKREGLRPNGFIDPSDQQPPTENTLHFSDEDIIDTMDEASPVENKNTPSTMEREADSTQG
eukprot:10019006-Ditylum_brightwellii.AAC.1